MPGRTNGAAAAADAAAALADAACAARVVALAWSEKMPFTKVASSDESVELAFAPDELTALSVTSGIRRP